MKKVLLLLIVGFVAFALFARLRLFVRDPLASVLHNGVKENGAQVYINYANDVLIENDHTPMYVLLLQHGNVGTPKELHCLHYFACLTEADQATLAGSGWNITIEDMTSKTVAYRGKDSETVISLY